MNMRNLLFGILVTVTVIACVPDMALAATINVPADYATIQEAITAASNGDTIIVADGTYIGANNKNLDFGGKAITVKSENGPANCIIDCQNSGRGFNFQSGETNAAIVEGFTIQNGNANFGSQFGGGIYCNNSSPTITNCAISGNSADLDGGGIGCESSSSPMITNCIITYNSTGCGGGICCESSSSPMITNCTIVNNSASMDAGGIHCYNNSNPVITNCTVANNSASTNAGGILCYDNSNPILNNTIVWANSATGGNQIYTLDNTCVVTLNYCDYANGPGDVEGLGTVTPTSCITLDPLFVNATAQDYHLQGTSPCIDIGNNAYVTEITDLDGNVRIQNGTVDMGAYESAAVIIINVPADYGTIQAAINAAANGDTVIVADGTYTGAGNKDLDFGGKAITVKSQNGAANCIIDCGGSGRGFIFQSGETSAAVLDGFTIQNGDVGFDHGPGIYLIGSSPTITNCKIINNTCNSYGGGISCTASSNPLITNCEIANNRTSAASFCNGGGIYCNASSPTVINCTIAYNTTAVGISGGGIYATNASFPTASNTIIYGNEIGFGIEDQVYMESGCSMVLNNCDIGTGITGTVTQNSCINVNPVFVTPASSVGPGGYGDYHLQGTSPCINAGDNSYVPGSVLTDLDGDARIQNGTVDMGAYESTAAIINVPADYGTIQAAINAAANGDTVIVADGTYTGAGNKDLDFGGRIITLKSAGGAVNCIIDCESSGRGFYFHTSETSSSVVEGFTIRSGYVDSQGGAIYIVNSSPTITNCIFENNQARPNGGWLGGAIYCTGSAPSITNCTFSHNLARYGGAIACDTISSLTITSCIFTDNWAQFSGGAMYFIGSSDSQIANCLIADNTASNDRGGGIFSTACELEIANCTIVNNNGTNYGGGYYKQDDCNSYMRNCIIWGNTAITGGAQIYEQNNGGVYLYSCDYGSGILGTVTPDANCIINDPMFVDSPGKDYHLQASSPCIDSGENSYATGLTADLDGNARIEDGDGDSTATVDMGCYELPDPDTVIADFTSDVTSGPASLIVNFTDISNGTITSWAWDFDNDGTTDSTSQNPSWNYGTPGVYTVKLTVTGPGGTDEEIKLGYIAVGDTIYVDGGVAASGNGLSWATAKKSIQEGIDAAGTAGWKIIVADGTYTGAGNKSLDFGGKLIPLKSVGGPDNCIIDCENSGRAFYFHTFETNDAVVEGFTIRNGYVDNEGGAIYIANACPTITNCVFQDNTANWSSGYWGGAIYCYSSDMVVIGCTFTGNQARYGGAIACSFMSDATITNCILTGNWAQYRGGALYCSENSDVRITNCLIAENSADNDRGGGIYSWKCNLEIADCTITKNTATNYGGGYAKEGDSTSVLKNCIIWGNTCTVIGTQIYEQHNGNVELYSCDYGTSLAGSVIPDGNSINVDPQFVDFAGGNYHLQGSSPCVDTGDNTLIPAGITTDIDGNARIQNSTVDMGAYETAPSGFAPPSGFSGVGIDTDKIEWTWNDDVPSADAYLLQDAGSGTIAIIPRPAVLYQETVAGENTQVTRQIRSCTTTALTEITVEPVGPKMGVAVPWNTVGYRAQYLYTAAELGGTAGAITKVYWQRLNPGSVVTYGNVSVTLGHSTKTSLEATFANNFAAGPVQVRDPATYDAPATAVSGEWVEIPLDRTFYYNGTDNLVVDIDVPSGGDNIAWSEVTVAVGQYPLVYSNPGAPTGVPWERKFFLKVEIEEVGSTSAPAGPVSVYTLVHDPTISDFTLVDNGDLTAEITITPPPNSTSGSTGVKIERATNDTFTENATTVQDFAASYSLTDSVPAEGTYYYRITYHNGDGVPSAASSGKSVSVTAPGPPVADFTADVTNGAAPLTVNFTDASTGAITSWEWDFENDGTVDSIAQNPSWSYGSAGTYTVKLTITGPTGTDEQTKVNYISVSAGGLAPPSGFSGVGIDTDKIEWTWNDDVPSADAYLLQDTGSGTIAIIPRPAVLYQEIVVGENALVTRQIRSCTTAASALTVEPIGSVAGVQLPWNVVGYRAQYLYTAAELANTAGNITKIYWQRLNSGAAASYGNVSVQVGHSTKDSLDADCASNFDAGGPVMVRDPAAYAMPATGGIEEWVEVPLDRSFYYNGTDNLIIDIDVPPGGSNNVSWSKVDMPPGDCPSLYAGSGGSAGVPIEWKFFVKVEMDVVNLTSSPTSASAYTLTHDATVGDFSLGLSGTDVVVTITPPPNQSSGLTGVRIERASNDTFTVNFTICQLFTDNYSYTDTSTIAGNTYWYRIIYRSGDGVASATSAGESIFVTSVNSPPIVSVMTPASPSSSPVTIAYDLADSDGDNCTVSFDYSTNGGSTWNACTAASGDSNPQTSVAPGTHSFQWDADADLTSQVVDVEVRVTADDGNGGNGNNTTSVFTVDTGTPLVPPSNFSGVGIDTDKIEWTWNDDVPGADAYLLQDAGSSTIATIPRPAVLYQETVTGENTQVTRLIRSCTTTSIPLTIEPPGTVTGASLPWYVSGYHAQYLYTAADLSNQAGTITKIYWQRTNFGSGATYSNVSVTLGHTTKASLEDICANNFNVDGSTQVRDPATYDAPVTSTDREWVEIPLDRGFPYDGTNNLVIDIDAAFGTDSLAWSKVDTIGVYSSFYAAPGATSGMPWDRKFFLKVEVEVTGGTSAPAIASAYTLVHDATVDDFSLALGGTGTEVVITVNEPPNAHASFTGVKIERATNNTFTANATILQAFSDSYVYTDTSTAAGITYWYRITFCNGDGIASAASAGESVTVLGTNCPPVAAIIAPTGGSHTGDIPISYNLRDYDSDPADITVEYSTDGGSTWNLCTMGTGGDGTASLTTSPAGTTHTFVWDTMADDVGTSVTEPVQVRIMPSDKDGTGTPDSAGFTVSNIPQEPPVVTITDPIAGLHSGDITITYVLTDVNADNCDLTVEYSADAGVTWDPCYPGAGGDGVTGLASSASGVTHTFVWASETDMPSTFDNVTLRVIADDGNSATGGGTGSDTTSFNVDNGAAVTAHFAGTPVAGNAPLTVQFTDMSVGSITSWQWAFGDGGTSSSQNPSHQYTVAGDYAVSLTVTGPAGSNTETRMGYISVIGFGPSANFTASTVTGDAPLTVQFTDTSAGTYDAWLWDFGDGGTSTQQNPAHTYNLVGTYTVTLIIDGPEGNDSETKVDYITVTDPGTITAHFSGTPAVGSAPLDVQFTDLSVGNITSWAWSFGDGGTSSSQNPSHQYSSAGDYTVSLTVTGPAGSDIETRAGYISVVVTNPGANFTGSPATGDAPLAVQFTDTSTGTVTSWLWDFGDGGTSTQQSPSHLYRLVGIYTVTLTVDGPGGSDFMVATDYVAVTDPGTVAADFSAVPAAGTPPLDVQFTDMSVGNISSWAWNFGDGGTSTLRSPTHQYINAGTYTVTLTVSGPPGSDVQTRTDCVNVGAGAARRGGAIFCESGSSPTIIGCVIKDCSADYGGAIACDNSSPAIVNCAIVNNSATNYGGGICSKNASPAIINCTIADNTAGNLGGGLYCEGSSSVALENTIIWGNSASSQGNQIYIYGNTDVVTLNYCNYADSAGDIAGAGTLTPNNCIALDPLFVIGTKGSYYLSQVAAGQGSDSPCLDAGGDTAVSLGLNTKTTRTDGTTDTGTVDIGYHYEP